MECNIKEQPYLIATGFSRDDCWVCPIYPKAEDIVGVVGCLIEESDVEFYTPKGEMVIKFESMPSDTAQENLVWCVDEYFRQNELLPILLAEDWPDFVEAEVPDEEWAAQFRRYYIEDGETYEYRGGFMDDDINFPYIEVRYVENNEPKSVAMMSTTNNICAAIGRYGKTNHVQLYDPNGVQLIVGNITDGIHYCFSASFAYHSLLPLFEVIRENGCYPEIEFAVSETKNDVSMEMMH